MYLPMNFLGSPYLSVISARSDQSCVVEEDKVLFLRDHTFCTNVLNPCCIPGTVLGSGDNVVTTTDNK